MPGSDVWSVADTSMPLSIVNPAEAASSVRGSTPMPTTTRSAAIRSPPAVSTASTRSHPAIDASDLGAEDALQRDRVRSDHRDPSAEHPEGRRDLAADPASADHDDPVGVLGRDSKGVRVGKCPQRDDTRQIRAGEWEPPWTRP